MSADKTISSLELLYQVSRELTSALDLRTVLQRILLHSVEKVGGERASIVVLDDRGEAVDAAIVYGRNIQDHTTQQLRETVERGLAGWVVRNRKPAWVPDTSQDERWLRRPDDALDRSGAKAALCVPLFARETLVGVLTLVHPVPGSYSMEHFSLMQAIADLSGVAVLNARLYAESQRQARVMTAQVASAAAINASLELDEVLQRILDETIRALQVETVALGLVDVNDTLVFRAATGAGKAAILGKRMDAGQGIEGRVILKGEGVVIPEVQDDKNLDPGEMVSCLDARSIALAPIHAQGKVIGILQAINPVSGTFGADALVVLAGIGNLAGSTIQHAILFERLRVAHKRLRELFDDCLDPILVTDLDGKIIEANRQAEVLSGYTSRQLQGKLIYDLHEPEIGTDHETDFRRIQAGKTLGYEALLKARTGEKIPIQMSVKHVQLEDTENLQWLLRDISERKSLDLLREDLTAMIYHDLRSPLANIISSLDVLSSMHSAGTGNETLISVVQIARQSTDRIQRLVSSLLDINRLENGQTIHDRQVFDPSMLVGEVLEIIRPMTDSRHQKLEDSIPDGLPPICVNVDMIRRVLINLMENASKFTPLEGKVQLGVQVDGPWVKFFVADNGPGIPFADQERIFDKFTRLIGEKGPSGLGLGLAFSRLAIQGHGGRIWVESKPEQGTRFVLTLPIYKNN